MGGIVVRASCVCFLHSIIVCNFNFSRTRVGALNTLSNTCSLNQMPHDNLSTNPYIYIYICLHIHQSLKLWDKDRVVTQTIHRYPTFHLRCKRIGETMWKHHVSISHKLLQLLYVFHFLCAWICALDTWWPKEITLGDFPTNLHIYMRNVFTHP